MDAGALVLVLSSWTGDLCSLAQTRCPRAPPISLGGARPEKLLRVPPSRWDPVHASAPDKCPAKAGACLWFTTRFPASKAGPVTQQVFNN